MDKIRFSPMPGQVLGHVDNFGGDSDDPAGFGEPVESVTDIDAANVITSKVAHLVNLFGQRHKVMVDVDMPCKVVPSTTPGHFHLYIDREMSWHDYKLLLGTFERVGIISTGYHDASILRGFTTLRLPWIKKKSPADTEYHGEPVTVPVPGIEDSNGWAHDEGPRSF